MLGKLKHFNWNYVAVGILVLGYGFSVVRLLYLSIQDRGGEEQGSGVIRVTHWQLEPGFREAMEWAISKYNAQPKVKAAGIRVEQAAITERVYNQFMNVHLISGTAPDIAEKGMSQIIKGNALARFYTPLGEYVNQPNPYNGSKFVDESRPKALREFLAKASWRETFIDGMEGGYVKEMNDFYAVPISVPGNLRIFYNLKLTGEVKRFALKALSENRNAEWIQRCRLKKSEDGLPEGYLPIDRQLEAWLADGDTTPQTLGQLFFFCEAILRYAEVNGRPNLVPISASNYGPNDISSLYRVPFSRNYSLKASRFPGKEVDMLEVLEAYRHGVWDFNTPGCRESYRMSSEIVRYYPVGFLGKDREQAQRRFVLGDAVMLSSGGWDAGGIFRGVASRDREEDRFEVGVAACPLPDEDERWADLIPDRATEADFKTSAPLAINLKTPHFKWALDFLKFMTSLEINETFNAKAGWLPSVEGANPIKTMSAFTPIRDGIPTLESFSLEEAKQSIKAGFSSNGKLLKGGEIGYEEFVRRVDYILKQPRQGIDSQWQTSLQKHLDQSLAQDRAVSVSRFRELFDASAQETRGHLAKMQTSVYIDEARRVHQMWKKFNGDKPFPENN